jgi:hypothetical protein
MLCTSPSFFPPQKVGRVQGFFSYTLTKGYRLTPHPCTPTLLLDLYRRNSAPPLILILWQPLMMQDV